MSAQPKYLGGPRLPVGPEFDKEYYGEEGIRIVKHNPRQPHRLTEGWPIRIAYPLVDDSVPVKDLRGSGRVSCEAE